MWVFKTLLSRNLYSKAPFGAKFEPMNTGEWLDQWLASRLVTPRTLERYGAAVATLKESLAFTDLLEITPELVEKVCGEDKNSRSVLSMALGEAVKAGLITKNMAAIKREQRSPQEGSLYYRADRKAWVAQVTVTEPGGGTQIKKRKLIKVAKRTKNPPPEAVKALEALKAIKLSGGLLKGTSTVGELMEEWLANLRVKTSNQGNGLAIRTFEQYSDISRSHIIPSLGGIKIKDLNKVKVEKWLHMMEGTSYKKGTSIRTYSANTIRLCRTVLGMALKWGVAEGHVGKNVAAETRPAGGRPRPEKHALSEDQAKRLIEATRGSEVGPLWALMITTGLRRGEALGLRWIDFDGESITVTSQLKIEGGKVTRGELKTERSKRRLRLPDFLIADLEAHKVAQLNTATNEGRELPELIFTNSQGSHIRPDNLTKRFVSACKKAGIEPHEDGRAWSVHELRHTAASQLLNDRVPMQIVSRTLGHSSITVTLDVYSHFTDQDSKLVADSMAKRYGSKPVTDD